MVHTQHFLHVPYTLVTPARNALASPGETGADGTPDGLLAVPTKDIAVSRSPNHPKTLFLGGF